MPKGAESQLPIIYQGNPPLNHRDYCSLLYLSLCLCLISSFLSWFTKTRGNDTNILDFNQNIIHNTVFYFFLTPWTLMRIDKQSFFSPKQSCLPGNQGQRGCKASRLSREDISSLCSATSMSQRTWTKERCLSHFILHGWYGVVWHI